MATVQLMAEQRDEASAEGGAGEMLLLGAAYIVGRDQSFSAALRIILLLFRL